MRVPYLDVPVREEQVHHDILSQNFGVIDAQLDSGQFLRQLLALVLLPSFTDVVQQGVFKGGAATQEYFNDRNPSRIGTYVVP